MKNPPKEGYAWAAAAALSLPVFLLPLYNPDVFWHLSAGRWMLEQSALPRADFLSFTMPGEPWQDFEWLCQGIYFILHRAGGMAALWALKALILAAVALTAAATLGLHGAPAAARARRPPCSARRGCSPNPT